MARKRGSFVGPYSAFACLATSLLFFMLAFTTSRPLEAGLFGVFFLIAAVVCQLAILSENMNRRRK